MNTKFEFETDAAESTVYIRQVAVASLPKDLREQIEGTDNLYAVHGADGSRLALVKDRNLAFMLARQNEMTPVSVH